MHAEPRSAPGSTAKPSTTLSVNVLGGDDRIDASMLTGTDLVADGGVGGDYILDGAGNDTINGGPGGDVNIAGGGSDVFNGGDGDDTADYSGRATPVSIALNGQAVSGAAGEGDVVGADVEGAFGGAGNDAISGNGLGTA